MTTEHKPHSGFRLVEESLRAYFMDEDPDVDFTATIKALHDLEEQLETSEEKFRLLHVASHQEITRLKEQLESAREVSMDCPHCGKHLSVWRTMTHQFSYEQLLEQYQALHTAASKLLEPKSYVLKTGDHTWIIGKNAIDELRAVLNASNPAKRLHDLTIDDSQNEPPDVKTDDDFDI